MESYWLDIKYSPQISSSCSAPLTAALARALMTSNLDYLSEYFAIPASLPASQDVGVWQRANALFLKQKTKNNALALATSAGVKEGGEWGQGLV